jgi:hypothetical protein
MLFEVAMLANDRSVLGCMYSARLMASVSDVMEKEAAGHVVSKSCSAALTVKALISRSIFALRFLDA